MAARGLLLALLACGLAPARTAHPARTAPEWECGKAEAPGRTVPRGDIALLAGRPLAIDCELRPEPGQSLSAASLHFERNGDPVEADFVRVNGSVLQLRVPSMPESDSMYTCKRTYANGTVIGVCHNSVTVGVPPRDVTDLSCVSANWENLTCVWRPPHNYLRTEYEIGYRIPGRASRNYLYHCPNVTVDATGLHSCFWSSTTDPHYRRPYDRFHLRLTGRNAVGNNTQEFPFDHYGRVKPSPPENVRVTKKTSHGATLSWRLPSPIDQFPAGIAQKIKYCTSSDGCTRWTPVEFDSDANSGANFSLQLTDLPFANTFYDVRLTLKSKKARDDLWSDFSSATFLTQSELPSRPPDFDAGGFEAITGLPKRTVRIYWGQIMPHEENGDNFTYRIVAVDPPAPQFVGKTSDSSFLELSDFPLAETTVTAVSTNLVGPSVDSSSITIPQQGSLLPEPGTFTKMAFDDRVYELSWTAVRHADLESYTIFWCNSDRDRPYPCKGRLRWERVAADATATNVTVADDKIYQFAISANGRRSNSGMVWASCTILANKNVSKMRNVWINQVGVHYIEVAWKLDCSDRIGVVQGYRVSYCPIVSLYDKTCNGDVLNKTIVDSSTGTSANITGLRPHTTYQIHVSIITKYGDSTPSDPLFNLTNEGQPTPPTNVAVSHVGNSEMLVSWQPPETMNGFLKEYFVVYGTETEGNLTVKIGRDEKHLEVKLTGLVGYANYTVWVKACTVTCSDESIPVRVRTAIGPPGQIEKISRPELYNSSQKVVLAWNPPKKPGGIVDYYEVKVVEYSTDKNRTFSYNSTKSEFEVSIPICQEPDVTSYAYFVRAINIDGAPDHGAMALSDERFVEIIHHSEKFDPISYAGPWSEPSDNICYSKRGSSIVLILGLAVVLILGVAAMIYFGKRIYTCYQKMKNIKPCMPPGLEPHLEKDLKLGKWGGDIEKSTDSTPDAEYLLQMKDPSRNLDIKRSDCDDSNCSVNAESTATFSVTGSNRTSDSAEEGAELRDDAGSDSPSPNSSLRLRNVAADSGPGSFASSQPWNSDGMAPYSAVCAWPTPDPFVETEEAPNPPTQKGYVSFGALSNDKLFNVKNALPRAGPPIPDLPSNYVVSGIDFNPPTPPAAKKSGYVCVNDPIVTGKKPLPALKMPSAADGHRGESGYVQLPDARNFSNKPVISTCAYIKNSDLRTDNLDAPPPTYPQKITCAPSSSPKRVNVANANLLFDDSDPSRDSLSPTYCKFGLNSNAPHPFDFQPPEDMHGDYLTDSSDAINHDNENHTFLIEPPAKSNSSVSSHYVPHNPSANRL